MTIALLAPSPVPTPKLMPQLTAAAGALLLLTLLWGSFETRTLVGDPVWLKPAKFALSFVVTFGALALLQSRLSRDWADGWALRGTAAVMATAFVGEMAYMTAQAARGEASHFNFSTPFNESMYQIMGVGAVLLVLGIGVFGVVALLDRGARMSPTLRLATGLGFLATVLLTLPIAGYLGGNLGHHVGVAPPGAPAIPFLGWSGAVGDLRPAHFLALHAMQELPLYALWRERGGRARAGARLHWPPPPGSASQSRCSHRPWLGLPLVRL